MSQAQPAAENPYFPPTPPPGPLEYHRLQRGGRRGWWWSLIGIAVVLLGFGVLVPMLVTLLALAGLVVAHGSEGPDRLLDLVDVGEVTPGVLLFLDVVLIATIPMAMGCLWLVNGLRPRWLSSVAPGIRWRWLAVCFAPAFASLALALLLGSLLPGAESESVSATVNSFTSTTRDFLLVIVLFTPLQAAAEEYVFRGYLTQAFGSMFASPRLALVAAVLVPALVFALFHGSQSVPVFIDRLAFGIVAGILVIATGGLEAGIAYHVLNNLIAFVVTLFFGDITEVLTPTGGTWWDVVVSVVKSVVFVLLTLWAGRRMGVRTRTERGVLEG